MNNIEFESKVVNMNSIETLLTRMFDIMDSEFNNPYIVMNKYDEVPYKLPSDLDMSITPDDFKRLDTIIPKIAKGIHLIIVQKIWHGYQKCAYILSPLEPHEPFRLQLDFFTDFSVKHTPLLISYKEMQNETRKYGRFQVPSYRMEYVFLLMRRIFKDYIDEEHFEAIKKSVNGDKNGCYLYLKQYFDDETAEEINKYVNQDDINGLRRIRPILWKKLQLLSQNNLCGTYKIRFLINELRRQWFRIKYPVGMCVALLSPDGGGKSSVYERIMNTCWGAFFGISKMYFRPHLLRNPGMLNPLNPVPESNDNPDPHGKKPNGFLKSLFRFSYYNIDYILGYNLLVRKKCIQKQLVVFDRYYYDYFVDMRRYRYSLPKWMPKVFAFLIPTPDVIFILDGTPRVLYERKKELPINEIERQVKEYRRVASKYRNAKLINVDEPLDKVVNNVTRSLLMFKAQRTAKSMNICLDEAGIPQI